MEVWFEEMYHAEFRARVNDIHEGFFVFDFRVLAVGVVVAEAFGARKFFMELLQALLPVDGEGGVVVEGVEEIGFIVRGGGAALIGVRTVVEDGGYGGVDGCHGSGSGGLFWGRQGVSDLF